MNKQKQKIVSRIICGLILPLVLLANVGAARVAYAEAEKPKASPGITCPAGLTPAPTGGSCFINGYKGEEKEKALCTTGFHVDKTNSVVASATATPKEGVLYCAQDAISTTQIDNKAITNGIFIIAGVQKTLNRLIWPVLVMTGSLMGNDLLFGNGMEEKLRDIWIPIRNLVNILFVVVLVGLALYNVLGLSEDTTSIKAMLPKIVIGIIAVNFSFLAIKVVLDGINVMTTAVFALPDQVSQGLSDSSIPKDQQARLCAAFEGTPFSQFKEKVDVVMIKAKELEIYRMVGKSFNTAIILEKGSPITDTDSIDDIKKKVTILNEADKANFEKKLANAQNQDLCTGKELNDQGVIFLQHYNSRNAAFALALNMGKIVFYNEVDTKSMTLDAGFEKLFTNALFSMILYVIYCVSFIALFIVLLGRLVVMWLCIAVSPILLLMMASSQVKEKMGGFGELADKFTKNAIAPLLISLSLTVGWIMLKAVQGLEIGSETAFKLNPSNGVPIAGFDTLQDFMVALGVIAVVWIGVFSAAKGTIAEGATDWIKGHVETAGKFLGSIPLKHMPVIPIALPDHPHDHYTFSQLGHYIENIGRSDDNKLATNAGNKKTATDENLRDMHDQAGLTNWLKNAKDGNKDLTSKSYRESMGKWLKDSSNRQTISKLEGGSTEQKSLLKNMKLLAGPDEKAWKGAAEEINKNDLVHKSSGELPGTTPPGTPPKTPPPSGPAGIKEGSPAATALKKKGDSDTANQLRINAVNESKTAIDVEMRKTPTDTAEITKKTADIKKQVTNIGQKFTEARGSVPTKKELIEIFGGQKAYDAVVKECGGEAKFNEALKPPTPPPAAPAPGTTPPAATPPTRTP